MQPIATWLVARPQNSVFALAALLVLVPAQLSSFTSGATIVLLAMHADAQRVTVYATIAAAVAIGLGYLAGIPASFFVVTVASVWLPLGMLAVLMKRTRSLTLTLQLSVVLAIAAIVAIYVSLDDPVAAGGDLLDQFVAVLREVGNHSYADFLSSTRDDWAPLMTMFIVLAAWFLSLMGLMAGYALYSSLPGKDAVFGRFRSLNFGRVLAIVATAILLLSWVTNMALVEQLAFMCVAVFCVQGLALVHWYRSYKALPAIVIVIAYVLLFLLPFVAPLMAMAGYADAWLDVRARVAQKG